MNKKQLEQVVSHLKKADDYMRKLSGFYWHRRHNGISIKMWSQLVRDIKRGARLIEKLEVK